MCVLIVKKQGAKVPTKDILTACAKVNPDGFGIATPDGLFKTLDKDAFIQTACNLDKDTPAILHCRLATHGSVKVENCHPFEQGDWVFAHNGILYNIKPYKDLTDSETAFKQIFYPLIEANKGINTNVNAVIQNLLGWSKFAFMNKKTQKIYTFGEFETINGVMFSNTKWQPATKQNSSRWSYRNRGFYKEIFADSEAPF